MNASPSRNLLLVLASSGLLLASGAVASGQAVVHYACQADQWLDQYVPDDLGHMGQSIAIGDFNHDGIPDVVLGGYDRGLAETNEPLDDQITCVYVFLGTGNSPLSGLPMFRHRLTVRGFQALDLFGFSVAFIGNIGGDEADDIVVGAPRFDGPGLTDSGRVAIIHGLANLEPTADAPWDMTAEYAVAFSFDGTINGGWFGASVATARDSSGNFLKDLLVGAPGNSVASTTVYGTVYLYGTPTVEQAGGLGSVTPGIPIIASGLTGTPGISGSPSTGYVAIAHRVPHGLAPGDIFGQSVAFVGDLDGEPGQEFLVGAPQYASETGSPTTKGPGYVQLFRTSSTTPLITILGDQEPDDDPRQEGEAFGFSVAGGANLNPLEDSVPDIVVGAPLFDAPAIDELGTPQLRAGRVCAFSGAAAADELKDPLLVDDPEVNGTVMVGIDALDQFGYAVCVLPDLNVDGGPEILVGAWQGAVADSTVCTPTPPHTDPPRTELGGYAILFTSGFTPGGPPPGAALAIFYGEAAKEHLGRAVAADDLYGSSGKPEIVIGGVAYTPVGSTQEDPADQGRGDVWNGDTVLLPLP